MNKFAEKEMYELVDIYNGSTPSSTNQEYFGDDIPWITPKDLSNLQLKYISKGERNLTKLGLKKIGNKLLPKGTILLSSRAPIGLIAITSNPLSTNQGFKNLVCKPDQIDSEYLYYILKAKITDISLLGTGTTFKEVSKATLEKFKITIHQDVSIQRTIANVLSTLDKKIDLNRSMNIELEKITKLIFDYWFVQFGFPDKNCKPYKSSGGQMAFNEALKQEIPLGWSVKSLNYFIEKDKSGDWGKEQAEGNYTTKVECIRGADINGINGKGEIKTPTRFILEKNEYKILAPNDLVIEISGGSPTQSTGRLACITTEVTERFKNSLICTNFCKAVTLISEDVVFYFTQSWNRAYENGVFFGFEGKTSGIKNLLFDSLVTHYKIPLPPEDLLIKFQEKVSLFEKQKQINLKQNQELAALRDWLLPMLMNGQVTIEDAQTELNNVAV